MTDVYFGYLQAIIYPVAVTEQAHVFFLGSNDFFSSFGYTVNYTLVLDSERCHLFIFSSVLAFCINLMFPFINQLYLNTSTCLQSTSVPLWDMDCP
jgi:hypothetical protein